MKTSAIILLLLMPVVSAAQGIYGMGEGDMQQMEKMRPCMQNIDQQKLDALGQQSKRLEDEIKALCAKGKRDDALQKVIKYGK